MFNIPGCEISVDYFGGNCPVQSEGKINGHPYYFRARGDSLSLDISYDHRNPLDVLFGEEPECVFNYSEDYGVWPDAGWIDDSLAKEFMVRGFTYFLKKVSP